MHGHLAAVPGRALGAVIIGLAAGLPADAHAALAAFHADVVAALRAAPGGGADPNPNPGPGDAKTPQEELVARLPALRALAGVGEAPGGTATVERSAAPAEAAPSASGKAGAAGAPSQGARNTEVVKLAKVPSASDSAVEQQDRSENKG